MNGDPGGLLLVALGTLVMKPQMREAEFVMGPGTGGF